MYGASPRLGGRRRFVKYNAVLRGIGNIKRSMHSSGGAPVSEVQLAQHLKQEAAREAAERRNQNGDFDELDLAGRCAR